MPLYPLQARKQRHPAGCERSPRQNGTEHQCNGVSQILAFIHVHPMSTWRSFGSTRRSSGSTRRPLGARRSHPQPEGCAHAEETTAPTRTAAARGPPRHGAHPVVLAALQASRDAGRELAPPSRKLASGLLMGCRATSLGSRRQAREASCGAEDVGTGLRPEGARTGRPGSQTASGARAQPSSQACAARGSTSGGGTFAEPFAPGPGTRDGQR